MRSTGEAGGGCEHRGSGYWRRCGQGASFGTVRNPIGGPEWKTTLIDTDIDRKGDVLQGDCEEGARGSMGSSCGWPNDLTVVQGVEMVER